MEVGGGVRRRLRRVGLGGASEVRRRMEGVNRWKAEGAEG